MASTLTVDDISIKLAEHFSGKVPADDPHLEQMASRLTVSDISEFLKGIELAPINIYT